MLIKFVTKQAEPKEKLLNIVEKKLSKLDKYFREEPEATVTFTKNKTSERLEIMISAAGMLFRAEVDGPSFYHDIDDALDMIERQIRKNKTRLAQRMKDSFVPDVAQDSDDGLYEDEPEFIVREKTFSIRPMSVEEAILQMNLLGHEFFIFVNQDSEETCVVYKRKDQSYGLIRTNQAGE
ncbi:MAG: ribosome-associated translation inhibitor RaiA [Clostridia bacterium]|nr:ribosome-associated translation inhibitor RaiA [Clostridia bacterium]